jgi:hypothetical protein
MPGSPAPEAVQSGYKYWVRGGEGAPAPAPKVREMRNARALPASLLSSFPPPHLSALSLQTPQALSAAEAAALPASTAGGGSAWNAAGTWEDRDCSAAAKAGLASRLEGLVVSGEGGGSDAAIATVTGVEAVTGEATLSIVRGVRRAGFDFDVTVRWEAKNSSSSGSGENGGGDGGEGASAVSGTARIPNLASDELDDLRVEDVNVTGGQGGGSSVPVGFGPALARAVGAAVEGLVAELVARMDGEK